MNTYETVIVLEPKSDISYEKRRLLDLFQDYSKIKRVKLDDMGEKYLVYEIKKSKTGYYLIFTWQGTHENTRDAERFMRTNDAVLKFITVKLEEGDPKIDKLLDLNINPKKVNRKIDALDVLLGLANYYN